MRQNKALYHKRPQSVGAIDLLAINGDQASFAQYTKDGPVEVKEKKIYLKPEETSEKYPFMIPLEIEFPEFLSLKNQPSQRRTFVYTVNGYQPKIDQPRMDQPRIDQLKIHQPKMDGAPFSFPTIEFEPLENQNANRHSLSPRKVPHQRNKSEHSILSKATQSPKVTPSHRQSRSVFIPDLSRAEFQTPTRERQQSPLRNFVATRSDLEFPPLTSHHSNVSKTNTASSASRSSTVSRSSKISKPHSTSSATSNGDSITIDLTQEVEELEIKPKPEVIVIDDDETKKDDALERIYSMYSKPQRERLKDVRKISSSSADSTSSFRKGDESIMVRPISQPLRKSVRMEERAPGKRLIPQKLPPQKGHTQSRSLQLDHCQRLDSPSQKLFQKAPQHRSPQTLQPASSNKSQKLESFSGNLRNDRGHRRTKSNLVTLFESAPQTQETQRDYYDYQQSPSYDFQTFIQARDKR